MYWLGNSYVSSSGAACFSGQACASSIVSAGTIQGTTMFASTVACSPSILSSGTICSTGNTCFGGATIVAGCIGIGTASPAQQLHLTGNLLLQNAQAIRFLNSTAAQRIVMTLDANDDLQLGGGIDDITLTTNSVERLRITNTGIACFACRVCVPQLIINANCIINPNILQAKNMDGSRTRSPPDHKRGKTSKVLQQNSYQSGNNRTIQRICERSKILAINQKI